MTKCNVDGTTFHNNSTVGYGICFRDHLGQLLIGKSDFLHSPSTVLEAEAIALLESLKMAIVNGMHVVLFETDSKTLVEIIKSHATSHNELRDLIVQCRSFLNSNPDFVVLFIRRQANKVAHSIARTSLSHYSPHIFYHVATTLYSLILNEMN
jgi:ribonuclease HI